jgi:hypothetical protein
LRQLCADDPRRAERMTAEAVGVYLDYSSSSCRRWATRPDSHGAAGLDTSLDSPDDIVPWQTAQPVPGYTYRARITEGGEATCRRRSLRSRAERGV